MKKFMSILLATVMLVAALTGCSSKPAADTNNANNADKDSKELHFVYVSPLLSHPVWLKAKEGFEQATKELGIKGDWVGPQNISPEEMAKLVETAVAQKADGIITQGIVPAAPLKEAADAKIPVLIVDSDVEGAEKVAFFGKDTELQAKLFLDAAEKKLGKDAKLKVGVMVATLNYKIAQDQIAAIKKVFSTHPGGFELVTQAESKSDKMKASTEWQNVLKGYPEINVAINLAAEAGPACAKVVQEMNIRDKVSIFAVDDIDETLDLIKKDQIDGTVVTSFWNYGYQAAYWLYQNITEGKKPEKINNDAGTIMVTKDNINNYSDTLKVKKDLK